MGRFARMVLAAVAIAAVLVVVAAISLPFFLNADSFRTRIESTLSKSLGRKVSIGKVEISVFSGSLVAHDATVADDPQFSQQPFIQADRVRIGVQMLPLILHREVQVRSFTLDSPHVQLLRAANGTWNYSSIGSAGAKTSQDEETKSTFPNLTVGSIDVSNGRITVGTQPTAGSSAAVQPSRIYDNVALSVKDFGFSNAFPFEGSAKLPGDGSVSIKGNAGPINQQDASATPFSGHLELKHIDPLAAGFVDAADGISGVVDSLVLDAAWSGQQMHVSKLLVDTPHLTLVRSNAPKPPKPAEANAEGTSMLQHLAIDSAEIKNGSVTLTTGGQAGQPAVYQSLNAQLTNLSAGNWSPFSLSAQLPRGGSLSAQGKAGPFNEANTAATPVDATISLKHVELETSGVLAPDAGISGLTNLDAHVLSNGETLNATGTAHVDGIKLAKNGQPSRKPVDAQFEVAQNERAMNGSIQHATINVGRAALNVAGTYQAAGNSTAINMKAGGQGVPIDEIEAFLPAVGVRLPQGSQLRGGTVTMDLTITGTTANPVVAGPVRLEGTQLAGFDLGAKLQSLSKFTGGAITASTGSGTNIRSFSAVIREQSGGVQADRIALDVAGVGTATGGGSISPAGALDFNTILKLTGLKISGGGIPGLGALGGQSAGGGATGGLAGALGGLGGLIPGGAGAAIGGKGLGSIGGLASVALKNGIPVAIRGTTSDPTFSPELGGLTRSFAAGAAQSFVGGKTAKNNPAGKAASDPLKNALGGLFGKH